MSSSPKIKVCCISSVEEAALAVASGASALGFVSSMPSGPGVIDDGLIAEIVASVPRSVSSFLLTCRRDAESIAEQHARCKTTTIQLVDHVELRELRKLREYLPGVELVQVIHVVSEEALDEASEVEAHVDALLLDSGNPKLAVKELGGTGRTHNWQVSRRICEQTSRPVFLAGGLNHGNVSEAIATVRPYGLDLCSGVRTQGRLDKTRLAIFMAAVRQSASSSNPKASGSV